MKISSIIENCAYNYKEKTALVFNNEKLSYSELNKLVNKLSNSLISLGIKKNDKVALLLPSSPNWIISFFAIAKIEAIVVPINALLSPHEISYIFSDCNVSSVVISPEFIDKIYSINSKSHELKNILTFGESKSPNTMNISELMNLSSDSFSTSNADGESTVVISYAHWDTGYPKGAMLSHKNFLFYCNAASKYHTSDDIFLCFSPLSHIFALCAGLILPLYKGGCIILRKHFIPEDVLAIVESQRVTTFAGTPIIYKALLKQIRKHSYDLSSLQFCITGGDFIDPEIIHQFEEKSGVPLLEGYGLTESLPVTCNPREGLHKHGSGGLPLDPGIFIRIVNESGQEDGVGEIILKSPTVMKGYYGKKEDTERILKDGWLYTGDIGRIDSNGFLYILRRKKRIIICGGYNIDPKEVEDVLLTHPVIEDVNISAHQDEFWGEIVKATIRLASDSDISPREIQDYCKERLAVYKIPRILELYHC